MMIWRDSYPERLALCHTLLRNQFKTWSLIWIHGYTNHLWFCPYIVREPVGSSNVFPFHLSPVSRYFPDQATNWNVIVKVESSCGSIEVNVSSTGNHMTHDHSTVTTTPDWLPPLIQLVFYETLEPPTVSSLKTLYMNSYVCGNLLCRGQGLE